MTSGLLFATTSCCSSPCELTDDDLRPLSDVAELLDVSDSDWPDQDLNEW